MSPYHGNDVEDTEYPSPVKSNLTSRPQRTTKFKARPAPYKHRWSSGSKPTMDLERPKSKLEDMFLILSKLQISLPKPGRNNTHSLKLND
jgi:hypothetical protein